MIRRREEERHWQFQCPECGIGDAELGMLAAAEEIYCEVCLSEQGMSVYLQRWLAVENG